MGTHCHTLSGTHGTRLKSNPSDTTDWHKSNVDKSWQANPDACTSTLTKDGVKVFVRIRPLPPDIASTARMHELRGEYHKEFSPSIYAHTKKTGRVMVSSEDGERERLHFFDFDGVCDEHFSNEDVWTVTRIRVTIVVIHSTLAPELK